MTDNIERLMNRIKEYVGLLKLKIPISNEYKKIIENDNTIHLFMTRSVWRTIGINMMVNAMIELGINKKLSVYEMQTTGRYNLRYIDYRNYYISTPLYFFKGLYFANIVGSPILYRNLLELRGEEYLEELKQLLSLDNPGINNYPYIESYQYINENIECRLELIEFINSHTIEEDNISL